MIRKYVCIERCIYGGKVYKVGDILLTRLVPPANRFLLTDADPRMQATNGEVDLDETYYYPYPGWDDLKFPVNALEIDKNNTKLFFDMVNKAIGFPDDCTDSDEDSVHFIAQLPHGRKNGSDFDLHCHWKQTQDAAPNWVITYRVYNNGELVPTEWITVPLSDLVFDYFPGTLGQISSGGLQDGSTLGISSFVEGKVSRVASGDSYVGDALLTEFDMHILFDGPGSGQVFQK